MQIKESFKFVIGWVRVHKLACNTGHQQAIL